jgi:glycosyltransferase involved in cell wall biosynthesis
MPRFSIITVVYNGASTVSDTISSVLQQDFDDFEYIIQEGLSTDNTKEIITGFSDQRIKYERKKDSGIYDAMNNGLARATGEIIAFLHSDDCYTNSNVLTVMHQFFSAQSIDAAYADLSYVERSNPEKVFRVWKAGEFKREKFLNGWMPPHPTFFVKRSVYQQFGSFRLDFSFAADYELMLRFLYRYQISVGYLPEEIIRMRAGGMSNASWRNRWLANREDKRAWQVNNLRPRFFTFVLKPFRKLLQFFVY